MAEFAYKNAKNASTGHTPFELNYSYHFQMLYREEVDSCSKSMSTDKISAELRELMTFYQRNLYHTQKRQKRAYDKGVKSWNYASGKKVWLNSKYIKTKYKRKLEVNFFGPFQVLYSFRKQAYKLELPKNWKIHDIFHVLPLE